MFSERTRRLPSLFGAQATLHAKSRATGQHKSEIIICVFAYEIHPAGRPVKSWRTA